MPIQPNVPKLSLDWNSHKNTYDCLIIGSGYGGSIMAARLATAQGIQKPSVCLLERGREWPIGDFPDTLGGFFDEQRAINPLGLYDILNYNDISIVKGSGLGGTSLVNANVAIIPEASTFDQSGWPASLNLATLQPFYDKALAVLKPNQFPPDKPLLKRKALEARAAQLGMHSELLNIVVTFDDTADNGSGIAQPACTRCGDCVTGCNVGSKNTLYMNYLPVAQRNGVEIFTQTEVQWIEPKPGGGYRVHGIHRQDRFNNQSFTIEATRVILSAGSINSTEILLRSATHGLPISTKIGSNFSGNGDFFGISYNGKDFLQVLGFGNHPNSPGAQFPPGPTITVGLRYNSDPKPNKHFLVEDVSFPTSLFQAAQVAFVALPGEEFGNDEIEKFVRGSQDLLQLDPYSPDGALNHSLLYLVTGFDNAKGTIRLNQHPLHPEGQPEVVWKNAGRQKIFSTINAALRGHAEALGGRFVENPTWAALGLKRLFTAHPLGGCPVGEDHNSGVVDEFGRVFSTSGSVFEGLRVVDGSIVPSALGVNPFMTISALAERIADNVISEL